MPKRQVLGNVGTLAPNAVRKMALLLRLLAMTLLCLVLVAPARAQEQPPSDQECARYAQQASLAAQFNEERGCGLTGGRYSTSYDDHYNWCRQNPASFVHNEGSKRDAEVSACFQCKGYARRAIEQFSQAFADCGNNVVTGPLWIPNSEDTHFAFCFLDRGNGKDPRFVFNPEADKHRDIRNADLAAC